MGLEAMLGQLLCTRPRCQVSHPSYHTIVGRHKIALLDYHIVASRGSCMAIHPHSKLSEAPACLQFKANHLCQGTEQTLWYPKSTTTYGLWWCPNLLPVHGYPSFQWPGRQPRPCYLLINFIGDPNRLTYQIDQESWRCAWPNWSNRQRRRRREDADAGAGQAWPIADGRGISQTRVPRHSRRGSSPANPLNTWACSRTSPCLAPIWKLHLLLSTSVN